MIGGEATIDDLRERIAELEQERDALAAYVEQLKAVFIEGLESTEDHDLDAWEEKAEHILAEQPTTTLARRDLLKQAEALERAINVMKQPMMDGGHAWLVRVEDIQAVAEDLRNQANQLEAGQ